MTEANMTDLEITRLCAEAMGYKRDDHKHHIRVFIGAYVFDYDPLHDDAQAMALGKSDPELFEEVIVEWASMIGCGETKANLNRLLCESFARKQNEQKAR